MLSRVAESIFWMSRYMEQSNRMLRLFHTKYVSTQDDLINVSWMPILDLYSNKTVEQKKEIHIQAKEVLNHLIIDKENPYSIINNIKLARENARSVQDNISKEMWQCLNEYYHIVRDDQIAFQINNGDPVTALDSLIKEGMLFNGTLDITMHRGEGFNFINIGKYISRAVTIIDFLAVRINESKQTSDANDESNLRFLLYSLSGYELYMRTNSGIISIERVMNFVFYNTDFPHSLTYAVNRLLRYFERLKNEKTIENFNKLEYLIGQCATNIKYSNVLENKEKIEEFLVQTRNELFNISNHFNKFYFNNT